MKEKEKKSFKKTVLSNRKDTDFKSMIFSSLPEVLVYINFPFLLLQVWSIMNMNQYEVIYELRYKPDWIIFFFFFKKSQKLFACFITNVQQK